MAAQIAKIDGGFLHRLVARRPDPAATSTGSQRRKEGHDPKWCGIRGRRLRSRSNISIPPPTTHGFRRSLAIRELAEQPLCFLCHGLLTRAAVVNCRVELRQTLSWCLPLARRFCRVPGERGPHPSVADERPTDSQWTRAPSGVCQAVPPGPVLHQRPAPVTEVAVPEVLTGSSEMYVANSSYLASSFNIALMRRDATPWTCRAA